LGVSSFMRRFEFTAPGTWQISDTITTSKPETVTSYLHADELIATQAAGVFTLGPGLLAAFNSTTPVTTTIEKNLLTAPGPPGAVDKGEVEERGVRLAITTRDKVQHLALQMKLRLQ